MPCRSTSRIPVALFSAVAVGAACGPTFAQEANPPGTTKTYPQSDGSTITATVKVGGKVKVTKTDKDGTVTESKTVTVPNAGVKADGCPPNTLC